MTEQQLRIRCAELMGWRNVHCKPGGNVPYGQPNDDWNKDAWEFGPCHPRYIPHEEEVTNYPADLTAAFTLVDALRDWSVLILRLNDNWQVTFARGGIFYEASNPSLAVAVCQCFVKCKESQL